MAGISTGLASRPTFDGNEAISAAYNRHLQAAIAAANRRSAERQNELQAIAHVGAAAAASSGRPARRSGGGGDPFADQREFERQNELDRREKSRQQAQARQQQSVLEQQWQEQNERVLGASQKRVDAGFDFSPLQKQKLAELDRAEEGINERLGRGIVSRAQALQEKLAILNQRASMVPQTRNQADPKQMELDRQFKEEQKRDAMKFRKDLQEEGQDFKTAGEMIEQQFGFNPHKRADGSDIAEPGNWRTASKGLTAAQRLDAFEKIRKQISKEELDRQDAATETGEPYKAMSSDQIDAKARQQLDQQLRAIGIAPDGQAGMNGTPNSANGTGVGGGSIAGPTADGTGAPGAAARKPSDLEQMMLTDPGFRQHVLTGEKALSPREAREMFKAPSFGIGPHDAGQMNDPYQAYSRARQQVLSETPVISNPQQLSRLPAGATFRAVAPDGSMKVLKNQPKSGGPVDQIVNDSAHQEALLSPTPLSRTEYASRFAAEKGHLEAADQYGSYLKARDVVSKSLLEPAQPQPERLQPQGTQQPTPPAPQMQQPQMQQPQMQGAPIIQPGFGPAGGNQQLPQIIPGGMAGQRMLADEAAANRDRQSAAQYAVERFGNKYAADFSKTGTPLNEKQFYQQNPPDKFSDYLPGKGYGEYRQAYDSFRNSAETPEKNAPEIKPQKFNPNELQQTMLSDPKLLKLFGQPNPLRMQDLPRALQDQKTFQQATEAQQMFRQGFRMPNVEPPAPPEPIRSSGGGGMSNRATGQGLSGSNDFLRTVQESAQQERAIVQAAQKDQALQNQAFQLALKAPNTGVGNGAPDNYFDAATGTWSGPFGVGPVRDRILASLRATGSSGPIGPLTGGGGGSGSGGIGQQPRRGAPPAPYSDSPQPTTSGLSYRSPPNGGNGGNLDLSGSGYEESFRGTPASGQGPTSFDDGPSPFPEGLSIPEYDSYPGYYPTDLNPTMPGALPPGDYGQPSNFDEFA